LAVFLNISTAATAVSRRQRTGLSFQQGSHGPIIIRLLNQPDAVLFVGPASLQADVIFCTVTRFGATFPMLAYRLLPAQARVTRLGLSGMFRLALDAPPTCANTAVILFFVTCQQLFVESFHGGDQDVLVGAAPLAQIYIRSLCAKLACVLLSSANPSIPGCTLIAGFLLEVGFASSLIAERACHESDT